MRRSHRGQGARVAHTALISGALALAGVTLVPTAGGAAVLPMNEQGDDAESSSICQVDEASLSWGVKESFRSYISGSIANGEWVTDNGAEYDTPEFRWQAQTGELPSDLSGGALSFVGGVHFTGHDGALQMDLANPSIEFVDQRSAYLLLDFGATDEADQEAPTSQQLRAAKIDLDSSLSATGTELLVSGASTRLTAEGAAAFNGEYGDYVAGDELDPISLEATVSGCELGVSQQALDGADPAAGETSEPQETDGPTGSAEQQQVPWLPIIIGGVAILVIGVTAGMLVAGRKRPAQPGTDDPAAPDAPPTTPQA